MLGFDPLTISTLFVLASAGDLCVMPKSTDINITPSTQKVQVITNRTLAQLQNEQIDTINPHSFNGVSVTQGFAQGKISMKAEVKLDYSTLPQYRAACLWYDTISVSFDIDPHIYIAKEVHQDRCMGQAVLAHEMKHVNADRQVVNKYSQIIGQKLITELKARGFMAGPVKIEEAEAIAERMKKTVMQIIELEHERMNLDRRDAQGQVDSAQEYARVAALCPDFNISPDMLDNGKKRSGR